MTAVAQDLEAILHDLSDSYPQAVKGWKTQHTVSQMVAAMAPVTFTPERLAAHRTALQKALDHIRRGDARRLMSTGPLTSPFASDESI